MPASSALHHRHQVQMTRRGLGKIADAAFEAVADPGPALRLVATAAAAAVTAFPLGAQTRKVDASGRLKVQTDPSLADVLGWDDGALEAVFTDGWLVLRQPGDLVGAASARNASTARFARGAAGAERITLKPAHLERIGLSADRHLLIAAAPAAGALVLVNPAVCLPGAPRIVTDLLGHTRP